MEKETKSKTKDNKKKILKEDKTKHAKLNTHANIFGHTLQLTNNIVPLVIPSFKDISSPIIYNIKTSRKHRSHEKKPDVASIKKDLTYSKEKKHKFETDKKKENKLNHESNSPRESLDLTSQNTLDDFNLNINQSCSFSESTDIKYRKENSKHKSNKGNAQKYFVSSSFDALATESMSDESIKKVKIHLMNESDKVIFSESIKNPIINAIKDCLSQLTNNYDVNVIITELKTAQKIIKYNSQKLDEVLMKLACLEKKITTHPEHTAKTNKSPRIRSAHKASKLEELSEDLIEVKDELSEEDYSETYNVPKRRLRYNGKSVVVAINENIETKEEKKKETLGWGEKVPEGGDLNASSSVSHQAVQPDRPNRIPARFCWTDADRMK
ncbi:unnamed protein product [Diatraea saccharalis]|uniref:Uncharacterized protein n=1 Tax=Diatraea saccharalis TaxID=40085 RepID=A0A9N9WLP4_9NEOP|nr:unnamed protein product [Diatraea saccharalis]